MIIVEEIMLLKYRNVLNQFLVCLDVWCYEDIECGRLGFVTNYFLKIPFSSQYLPPDVNKDPPSTVHWKLMKYVLEFDYQLSSSFLKDQEQNLTPCIFFFLSVLTAVMQAVGTRPQNSAYGLIVQLVVCEMA
ncbi:unnamed protein product [Lepidochelys kempii]